MYVAKKHLFVTIQLKIDNCRLKIIQVRQLSPLERGTAKRGGMSSQFSIFNSLKSSSNPHHDGERLQTRIHHIVATLTYRLILLPIQIKGTPVR